MNTVTVNLGNELSRNTRDAKTILLLSLISIVMPPLFLAALVYFIIYFNKRKELKSDQSLNNAYAELNGKTQKELRSVRWNKESLEQKVAASILEHKKMVVVLIIIGIVLTIMITYIGLAYLLGWV